MSYQFVRLETYSTKGNSKRRNVAAICAEAARAPDAAPHVAAPLPPKVLHGVDPMAALLMHDEHVARSKQALRGTGDRIRKDTHTLACCVASYPDFTRPAPEGQPSRPTIHDPDRRATYERWRADAIQFMLTEAERYGRRVLSIVEHTDEDHPHLHSIEIAANPRADCKAAHPGLIAKTAAEKASPQDKKAATRAFKMAMSGFQDDYFRAVGIKHGQARTGPKRRRLSRAAWNAEQREAASAADRLNRLAAEQEAASIAQAQAAAEKQRNIAFAANAQKVAAQLMEEAERTFSETAAKTAEIEKHYAALDRGLNAMQTGDIVGAHPRIVDAFEYGDISLDEKISLDQEIQPARHRLWVFAKKVTDFFVSKTKELLRRENDLKQREMAFEERIKSIEPYLNEAEQRAIGARSGRFRP